VFKILSLRAQGMERDSQICWEAQNELDGGISLSEAMATLCQVHVFSGFIPKGADAIRFEQRSDHSVQICPPRGGRNVPKKEGVPVVVKPKPSKPICPLCLDVKKDKWPDQLGVKFQLGGKEFFVAANPGPIYEGHTVISPTVHESAVMDIASLCALAQKTPDRWSVQNGPDAGVTINHLHFQSFKADNDLFAIRKVGVKKTWEKQVSDQPMTIEKFEAPYSSYRIRVKSMTPEIVEALVALQDDFLGLDSTNRLTYAITYNQEQGEYEIFFTPRNSDKKTTIDHLGLIGYPQPLGCMVSEEGSEKHWDSAKFQKFLRDIEMPGMAARFEEEVFCKRSFSLEEVVSLVEA
jgi:hypothetical protein